MELPAEVKGHCKGRGVTEGGGVTAGVRGHCRGERGH